MGTIGKVGAAAPEAPAAASTLSRTALQKVAKEFETLLVHQLLEAAKVAGDASPSGYMGMAVDGLATGVSNAGGLGLARQIELSLGRHDK